METRRDGITTRVATFAKNNFFFGSYLLRIVCTYLLYIHTCTITRTCPDDKEQWENRPGHPLTIHPDGI